LTPRNTYTRKATTMTITERVQEVFNKFNVKLTVTEEPRTEMAEAALDNGTVVYTDAEAFAEGVEAYIINDEGEKIPLPPGDYELEDGRTLVIGEGGIVSSIGQPEAEVEEVEASEEVEVEIEAEEEPGYVTKAEVEEMIKAALESIKDKEEMSVNPEAPKEAKEEVKEEVVDEVAVELAAVKAQLEDMKKQAAEAGLKHKAPSVKREPLNLKNLSTQERVSALLNQFSNQ
jgi:hypothetical protein